MYSEACQYAEVVFCFNCSPAAPHFGPPIPAFLWGLRLGRQDAENSQTGKEKHASGGRWGKSRDSLFWDHVQGLKKDGPNAPQRPVGWWIAPTTPQWGGQGQGRGTGAQCGGLQAPVQCPLPVGSDLRQAGGPVALSLDFLGP